jgi:hypothetical protein
MNPHHVLTPRQLYRECDPAGLGFTTADELQVPDGLNLQARAAEALRFGLGIQRAATTCSSWVSRVPGATNWCGRNCAAGPGTNHPARISAWCGISTIPMPRAGCPCRPAAAGPSWRHAGLAGRPGQCAQVLRMGTGRAGHRFPLLAELRERWDGSRTWPTTSTPWRRTCCSSWSACAAKLQDIDRLEAWLDDPGSLAGRYQVHLLVGREAGEGRRWNTGMGGAQLPVRRHRAAYPAGQWPGRPAPAARRRPAAGQWRLPRPRCRAPAGGHGAMAGFQAGAGHRAAGAGAFPQWCRRGAFAPQALPVRCRWS